MFGLWYAIAGLISGVVCSFIAKKKNRTQNNWYTLGQVFPVISVLVLLQLASLADEYAFHNEELEGQNEMAVQLVNNLP